MNCKSKLTYILALSIVILLILGFLLFYYKKYILIIPILLGGGILFLTVWNYSKENLDPIPPEAPASLDCSQLMSIVLDLFGINDTMIRTLITSQKIGGVSIMSHSIPIKEIVCKSSSNKSGITCHKDHIPGKVGLRLEKIGCLETCSICPAKIAACAAICFDKYGLASGAALKFADCENNCKYICDTCKDCWTSDFTCGYDITPENLTGMNTLIIPTISQFTCHVNTPLDGYVYLQISIPVNAPQLQATAKVEAGCLGVNTEANLTLTVDGFTSSVLINIPMKCINPDKYEYQIQTKYVSNYYPLFDYTQNIFQSYVIANTDGLDIDAQSIADLVDAFKHGTIQNISDMIGNTLKSAIDSRLSSLLKSHDGKTITFPLPILPCPQTCNGGVCPWKINPASKCCGGGTSTRTLSCPSLNCSTNIPPTTIPCPEPCNWEISPWSNCPNPPCGATSTRQVKCPADYECNGSIPPTSQACPGLKSGKYYMSTIIDGTKYFVGSYYSNTGVYVPHLTTDQKTAALFDWSCGPDTNSGLFTSNGAPFTFLDSTCKFSMSIGINPDKQPFYPIPVILLEQSDGTYEIKQGYLQNSHCNFKGSNSFSYQAYQGWYGAIKYVDFSFVNSGHPATGILYISFIPANIN